MILEGEKRDESLQNICDLNIVFFSRVFSSFVQVFVQEQSYFYVECKSATSSVDQQLK